MDHSRAMQIFPLLVLATALACAQLRARTAASGPDFRAAAAAYLVLLGEALDAEVALRVGTAAMLQDALATPGPKPIEAPGR